jgi:hypothetical protein
LQFACSQSLLELRPIQFLRFGPLEAVVGMRNDQDCEIAPDLKTEDMNIAY